MRIVDNSTVEVGATYTEPTTSQDGSPLTDLAYTNVFYKFGSNPDVKGPQVAASRPTGGGSISTSLLVPAPAGQRTSLDFYVRATDLTGNIGPATPTVTFIVDRVAPDAPSNFSIG